MALHEKTIGGDSEQPSTMFTIQLFVLMTATKNYEYIFGYYLFNCVFNCSPIFRVCSCTQLNLTELITP